MKLTTRAICDLGPSQCCAQGQATGERHGDGQDTEGYAGVVEGPPSGIQPGGCHGTGPAGTIA
jgi:hypothetical protein